MSVALITGTSTGIGRATALHLARLGFDVYAGLRTVESGAELMQSARAESLRLAPIVLDVNDDGSVRRGVGTVLDAGGRIDVLVNNAGIGGGGAIEDVPLDFAKGMFETNYFGAIRMIQAVLPDMRARRAGTIVNVSSMAGRVALASQGHYSAAKHALGAASLILAQEVGAFGIRVVVIEPGVVRTPIWNKAKRFTDDASPYYDHRRRLGMLFERILTRNPTLPEEVAEVIGHAIATDRPRLRYLVGADAEALVRGREALSDEEVIADATAVTDAEHIETMRHRYGIDLS
jgi:NAD(P)-dependent dehydrogenase (short-subunit alcohol dehydrogenase family)